jgi:uncharacterized membrane protein
MPDARIHVVLLGFADPDAARTGLGALRWLADHEHLEIEGHAVIAKDASGRVRVEESADLDAGPLHGGFVGGVAGALLAVATGPIGIGAAVGGAVIGAIAAGMHDAGFPDTELRAVGDLMARGESMLIVGVEREFAERLRSAIDSLPELAGVTYRQEADLTDVDELGEAISTYRRATAAPPR